MENNIIERGLLSQNKIMITITFMYQKVLTTSCQSVIYSNFFKIISFHSEILIQYLMYKEIALLRF